MFIKTGETSRRSPRVIMQTLRRSRRWKFQRRDVPESHLSQRHDVEIQHRNVPEHVEI